MEQSLPMEEVLQPQDAEQAKRTNYFALAIAASLALHVVGSVVILGLPSGSSSQQSVTYIDLTMPQQAAPMTVPAKKPEPQVAPAPEKQQVLPEKVETAEPAPQVEQPKAQPVQAAAPPQERPDANLPHSAMGLGLTRGFFRSLGEGETLRVGVKEYYLAMLQTINEKWWLDQELQKGKIRPVVVNLVIARNGEIVTSQVLQSSGNFIYDRAVLASLKAASPLPPLPQNYQGDYFQAPIRLVPPLNLMSW